VKRFINLASVAAILVAVVYVSLPAEAQQATPPYVSEETGKVVREPFVDYFLRTGGEAQYGPPTTNDYVDPRTGLLVQYFRKGRLEWHPTNPDPYKVQLGLLAQEMGFLQPPPALSAVSRLNDPACQYFDLTGHIACDEFLNFWLHNGGLDRFGYPITGYTQSNGFLAQYFQRAILEWHPERPVGQRVVLADLGDAFYDWANLEQWRRNPDDRTASVNEAPQLPATSIQARASVFSAIAVAKDPQTVFVYVTDQFGQPLGLAGVTLIVHYPDGMKYSPCRPPAPAARASRPSWCPRWTPVPSSRWSSSSPMAACSRARAPATWSGTSPD
jgi:hypothetical protein